jgi:hypothetical protein
MATSFKNNIITRIANGNNGKGIKTDSTRNSMLL